ncbi:MAG TPA: MFS transporter [Steroidobacteraceae bacterium]|nr:MFS transporter [Steroidobacteraceae bacterium]
MSYSFVAFRHAGFKPFLAGGVLAMMADNIEHVITYWVIFQHFKSPALGGFAVIAHWLPFLLFSVPVGALAERVDPRRLIQAGMVLFILVSLAWGVLILTGKLQMWHAAALLIVHGIAGVLWSPTSQLLLHDIVGRDGLQSAVRLNATGRYLGMFLGPAVGSGFLLAFGPAYALFVNALIYLPFTLWLWKAPFGPRFRGEQPAPAPAVRSIGDVLGVIRDIRHYPVVATMTMLAGGAAFFIGNAYQAQMPGFATDLGHGDPGISYSMLLAADAAGALTAGIALETFGLLRPDPRTALILATLWAIALGSFALASAYPLALLLLLVAGFLELSFNSMSQTLVQLHAPAEKRGRIIGVFSMASLGTRMFSGFSVGILGQMIGIHWSLALSAGLILLLAGALLTRS